MATSARTSTRNNMLASVVSDIGSAGYVWVWTGSPPAKSGGNFTAPTGTLLVIYQLPNPVGTESAGILTYGSVPNSTGLAAGTPGYIRQTNRAPLSLTQASISGTTVTYTGTITGGASNAFAGATVNISGFSNAGNNGTFSVISSTATTLVVTNSVGVNETHAGTALMDMESSTIQDCVLQNSAGIGSGDFNFNSTVSAGSVASLNSVIYTDGNP